MKMAIMQPYLFPYIGYFQLMNAVDVFVLYNDVHWINRGWINRNRILLNNLATTFTIPCKKTSQNKLINEVETNLDVKTTGKLLKTFEWAYKKAPFFEEIFPMIEKVITPVNTYIDKLVLTSLKSILDYLKIEKDIRLSSEHYMDSKGLGKAERLIAICEMEHCSTYINASGGKEIYQKEYFNKRNIDLFFLESPSIEYPQFDHHFIPNLSMLDVLMFNPKEKIRQFLSAYELV